MLFRGKDYCFYYMFKTNSVKKYLGTTKFAGNKIIWAPTAPEYPTPSWYQFIHSIDMRAIGE